MNERLPASVAAECPALHTYNENRAVEEKHKQLTARRNRMEAESVSIGGMLTELEELEAPPIEFDEKLWHAVVDRVTVYNDDRLVYSLKDGSEITVML